MSDDDQSAAAGSDALNVELYRSLQVGGEDSVRVNMCVVCSAPLKKTQTRQR